MLENYFKLKENKTTISIEVMAGLTTFFTMVYILAVNPQILSAAGMEPGGLFTATAIICIVGTLIMALVAKYPFAIAPGMGLNAFFAFVVADIVGWQTALFLLLIQGVIFMLLALAKFREAVFDAIPRNMKLSIGVGVGLFITHIGFQNAGFIVGDPATLVGLGNIQSLTVLLFLVGCVVTVALLQKGFKSGIFLGIILVYVLGLIAELVGLYEPGVHGYSLVPGGVVSLPPSIATVSLVTNWQEVSFVGVGVFTIISLILVLLFVEAIDTVGTLIGVSERAGFLDKDGKLPRVGAALFADASTTALGAVVGTSTSTTYIESATGIQAGGRTGLTSLVTAGLFFVAMFFWPIFAVVPAFATAPALVIVGLYMVSMVRKMDFDDFSESFPAFLVMIIMPLAYSVSDGMVFGVISYVLLKLILGRAKEVSWVMYMLAAVFVLKLAFPY
ncbi:MAG: NCS2 family permease [Defluviitaleaceae bacterium]|nr:NCS2 family permease [Defluviitaleaceae bacterium]